MKYDLKQEIFDQLKAQCLTIHQSGKKVKVEEALMSLMNAPGMAMHCPYHHFIMPAVLLTLASIEQEKSEAQLEEILIVAEERAKTVPAGFCGECGACGAAVGIGMTVSILTQATPKTTESWQWANEATGLCLQEIAKYPGPRCCKRTSFLAAKRGVPYINEKCNLNLEISEMIKCNYYEKNAECLEAQCPFYLEA